MPINLPNRAQPNEGRTGSGAACAAGRLTHPDSPPPSLTPRKAPCSAVPARRARTATPEKGPGAKGRPTPTRKEAEAAARSVRRPAMDKKAAQKLLRERRADSNAKVRQGMQTGDERYLPERDQGPVKRFIRNYVDARVSIAEFLLPLLVVIMVLQYSGSASCSSSATRCGRRPSSWSPSTRSWLLFRLKRALRAKFPDESLKGTTFYTLLRVLQLRWLRMPKPQVKIGGAPR